MLNKIKLAFYYFIVSKLPHSRLLPVINKFRCWYVHKVLKVIVDEDGNSKFQHNVYIGNGKRVKIGFGCHINENVFIQAATIGDQVLIAPNVAILGNSHVASDINTPIVLQGETDYEIAIIGDGAWLGRNVIVMPGVCIGRHTIIGAGAVVTKDIPDFAVAVGVPAKIIKYRNREVNNG